MQNYAQPTAAQLSTLNDIKSFIAKNGYSPTILELASIAGIRGNALAQRVDGLVRKGLVSRQRGLSRSLVPVKIEGSHARAAGNDEKADAKLHPLYLTKEQLLTLNELLGSDALASTDKVNELRHLVGSASQAAGS